MIFTHKLSFNRILCIVIVGIFSSACGMPLEQSGAAPAQVEIQAISPIIVLSPTAIAKMTLEPLATPTFFIPQLPPSAMQTQASLPLTDQPLLSPISTPVISNTYDLAEGLPIEEIFVSIVRRADGTYEKYLLPRKPIENSSDFDKSRDEFLDLKSGDLVVESFFPAYPRPKPGIPSQVEVQALSPLPIEQTSEPTIVLTEDIEQPDASSTPMTTPTVINLAKGLPNSKIIVIVVRRANGDVQKFVLPNAPFNDTDDFDAELKREINWGPQDDLLSVRCGGCNPPLKEPPPPADFVITPFPSPTVIDLLQGMIQVETLVVLIQRANGDYEQYLLPMSPVFTSPAAMDELTKQLHLGTKDVFIDAFRTSGHTEAQPTAPIVATPIPPPLDLLSTPFEHPGPTESPSPD